jgi:hypothetical protein
VSEEGGFGVSFIEKLIGVILLAVGLMAAYYTFTSTQVLGGFQGFFGFLTAALCVIGVFMMTAKPE